MRLCDVPVGGGQQSIDRLRGQGCDWPGEGAPQLGHHYRKGLESGKLLPPLRRQENSEEAPKATLPIISANRQVPKVVLQILQSQT